MLRLNCFIRVAADTREDVIKTALELVESSRKEKGCISYDLFESATRKDVLMICETWADEAALESHKASEHFSRLSPRLHATAEEMKLEKFPF